jgi:hypothetical protein
VLAHWQELVLVAIVARTLSEFGFLELVKLFVRVSVKPF